GAAGRSGGGAGGGGEPEGPPWQGGAGGWATRKRGTPQARADSRPAGSVNTATAPADTASWQNSAPWWLPPGSAAYRSPGRTRRESWVTPRTSSWPSGPVKGSGPGPAMTTPSSAASPDRGRPCALRGRGSAGTRRGYRCTRGVSGTPGRLAPSGGIFSDASANFITW